MSTFKNLYTTLTHTKNTSKPSTSSFGQIYSKTDGLLYFLSSSGVEYVLSVSQVIQTLDYIYASSTSISPTPLSLPWNSTIDVKNNISVNIGDNTIINIGTPGIYMVTYGKTVTDTNAPDGSTIESHIVLNSNDNNNYLRYGSDENQVLHNLGVVRYITESVGIINPSINSVIKINVNANSMVHGSSTSYEQPRINIHRVYDSFFTNANYLNVKSINIPNVASGVTLDVDWNTSIEAKGSLSSTSNVITTFQAGLYFVLYNIEWVGSGIISTPTLASYILVNNTDTIRYGSDAGTIMANGGNLRYSKSISAIMQLNGGQNVRLKAIQTTGQSITFSGSTADVYKHTNLWMFKLPETHVAFASIAPITLGVGTNPLTLSPSITTNTTIVGDTITFSTAGTYLISYNIELDATGVIGAPPSFETYLSGDNGVTRLGYLSEVLLVSGGLLRYSLAKSTKVEIPASGTLKWYFTNSTGGNVTLSTDINRQMRIACTKIY